MPSPFPGMNPYLEHEDAWHDFHKSFMPTAREMLAPQLGPNYFVKIDEATAQIRLPVPVDVESHSYLRILDRRDRRVVTVIELLSPAHKLPGSDRGQYVTKRARILSSPAHFVEIDLLRCGARMPAEGMSGCDYCVLVSSAEKRPLAGFWPIGLRDPLPTIPIPLHAPDPDVRLDLKAVLDGIYDAARYERFIYASEPSPRLRDEDATWAQSFVPQRPAT